MNITTQEIKHQVWVEFEPRSFTSAYSKGEKRAHALHIEWIWDGEEWWHAYATLEFRRIKASGEAYTNAQSTSLWRKDQEQLADVIEPTRPQYSPVEVAL